MTNKMIQVRDEVCQQPESKALDQNIILYIVLPLKTTTLIL